MGSLWSLKASVKRRQSRISLRLYYHTSIKVTILSHLKKTHSSDIFNKNSVQGENVYKGTEFSKHFVRFVKSITVVSNLITRKSVPSVIFSQPQHRKKFVIMENYEKT